MDGWVFSFGLMRYIFPALAGLWVCLQDECQANYYQQVEDPPQLVEVGEAKNQIPEFPRNTSA